MEELNPQAKQMADESMVRCLDAQARAIWPQELPLLQRYALAAGINVLDAGCGTGEISSRLATLFPEAQVLGVDIIEPHLAIGRSRYARLAPRLRFEHQSIYELALPDDSFDLVVCRHVLQAIPHAERVLRELTRVARPGAVLHLIAEDYGMLHFQQRDPDPNELWHQVPVSFGRATGTDLFIGRNIYSLLLRMGLEDIRIDFIIVDPLRVERATFAAILEAWRDGYCEPIGQFTSVSSAQARAYFEQMIANARDPNGYAVWMVPVASARVR
jgi:ubiquinone/menaquinone biosynthesis C-methylase UbiE